jgi:hypothetical protein
MSSPKDHKVSRRDTLKLATAVSALGVGLGIAIDGKEALAYEWVKLQAKDLGTLGIKVFGPGQDAQTQELLHTMDLSPMLIKWRGTGAITQFTVKLMNIKATGEEIVFQHGLTVVNQKV